MKQSVESYQWQGPGYQPLVFFGSWQVAVLNWEPAMDPDQIGEIERHLDTDEVFILGRGEAILYTECDHDFHITALQPGAVYNVPKGTWHNLVASKDACLWIVENSATHLQDTEVRRLDPAERSQILALIPERPANSDGSFDRSVGNMD